MKSVVAHVNVGEVEEAKKVLASTQASLGKPDPVLSAVSSYVSRLALQDFEGAENALQRLPVNITVLLKPVVSSERKANRAKQALIAGQVRGLVEGGTRTWNFTPLLKGRAMVWDYTKNDVEKAYELLTDDLRGSSRDGLITVFCVRKRWNVEIGRYSISNQPAYQEHMEVGVAYWPANEFAGIAEIAGGSPPAVRTVRYVPEYGSSVRIKEWVQKLPRQ